MTRDESDQRDGENRREVNRDGRRASDPRPTCPSCNLPIQDQPHGSDAECIRALEREIADRRSRRTDLKSLRRST